VDDKRGLSIKGLFSNYAEKYVDEAIIAIHDEFALGR